LRYKGQIVFEKRSLPYFNRLPKEYIENEACFIFVNQGAFSVRSQTEHLNFSAGTGLLAKCVNYFFETRAEQRAVGEGVEVIGVLLYPSLVEELFQYDLSLSRHKVDFNLKKIEISSLLENYKQSIAILLDHPELADEAMIKTKLKEFVLLISKTVDAPSQLDFLAAMFKPHFADFRAVIQKNLFSNLSIDELSALCHMSPSSFKRKFKTVYQESPKKYIAKKKVQRAAELLRSDELRISEVAYDCGFESLATFNRTFKTAFGKSPSEFRMN
jgi:AraC-like DNA-binding protein